MPNRSRLFGSAAVLALAALAACSTSESPTGPDDSVEFSIAGVWHVTENGSGCGETFSDSYPLTVTQNGSNIKVISDGIEFQATLVSRRLQSTLQFQEDGGLTSSQIDVTFNEEATDFNGTAEWTFVGATGSTCGGNSTLTGGK